MTSRKNSLQTPNLKRLSIVIILHIPLKWQGYTKQCHTTPKRNNSLLKGNSVLVTQDSKIALQNFHICTCFHWWTSAKNNRVNSIRFTLELGHVNNWKIPCLDRRIYVLPDKRICGSFLKLVRWKKMYIYRWEFSCEMEKNLSKNTIHSTEFIRPIMQRTTKISTFNISFSLQNGSLSINGSDKVHIVGKIVRIHIINAQYT